MSIADTPQPTVKPAPLSACRSGLPRRERGATSSDEFEPSGAGERERRPKVSRPSDTPDGFDFHLAVYAIF